MVNTKLNLSMTEPYVRQIYAKEGDTGRVLEIGLDDYPTENGTLRILRPDGVEVTADAIKSASGDAYKGDLVTFDALEEVPLTKCEVALESSQDLHGQSNPYPAGGGKNLVGLVSSPAHASVLTNVTESNASEDSITLTSSNATYACKRLFYTLSAGTYTIKFKAVSSDSFETVVTCYTYPAGTIITGWRSMVSGTAYTITLAEETTVDIRLFVTTSTASVRTVTFSEFQLEKGSPATSWSPYSNICPIEPSNGVNLVNIGGSVFDTQQNPTTALPLATYSLIKGFAYTGYVRPNNITSFSASGTTITLTTTTSDYGVGLIAEVEVGKTYTFSATHDGYVVFAYYDASGFFVSNENKGTQGSYSTTVPSGAKYLIVLIRGATAGTSNISIDKPQLEQGAVATPYVPYQGINLYQVGINQWDEQWEVGDISSGTGQNAAGTTTIRTKGYIPLVAGQSYYCHIGDNTVTNMRTRWYDKDFNYLGYEPAVNYNSVFTVPNGACYLRFTPQTMYGTTYKDDISINYPSTDHDYHAYNGTTYPLSLGQNVYGGKVDLVSGKLTIDKASVNMGLLNWVLSSGNNSRLISGTFSPNPKPTANTEKADALCSVYKVGTANQTYSHAEDKIFAIGAEGYAYVYDSSYSDANTFKADMSGQQLVYKLATPIEVDLTPTQISTLLGENNIWSSGEVEVAFEYDGLFAQLPQQATAVVGRCIGDVNFNGASTMPFTLVVKPNNKEQA